MPGVSFNITRFRDEMRVEFGKMKIGLQRVSQETVRTGFYAAVNNSPVLTGYLHHNWGVSISGDAHKTLEPRVIGPSDSEGNITPTYPAAILPRSISRIKWNSRVELYNDTSYATEANSTSSRSPHWGHLKNT